MSKRKPTLITFTTRKNRKDKAYRGELEIEPRNAHSQPDLAHGMLPGFNAEPDAEMLYEHGKCPEADHERPERWAATSF